MGLLNRKDHSSAVRRMANEGSLECDFPCAGTKLATGARQLGKTLVWLQLGARDGSNLATQ